MKKIRNAMFETNSSSTQSLSLKIKPKDEKWRTKEDIIKEDEKINKDDIFGGDITRELRSKFSKIVIMYQSYVNHYIERKNYIFNELGSMEGAEYNEPDYIDEIYYEPYTTYVTLDRDELSEDEQDDYDNYLEELEANDIELDKIRSYIFDQIATLNKKDKADAKYLVEEIDKHPSDDETAIDYFFSNSLLDFYRGGYNGIDSLFAPLGLSSSVGYLALIKKIVEDDDIYFLTKEGCMAEDCLPRIM